MKKKNNLPNKKIVYADKMMDNGVTRAFTEDGKEIYIKIKDGDNLKNKVIKRGYLKADEMNNFLVAHVTCQLLSGERKAPTKDHVLTPQKALWDEWLGKGIITKEQKKNIKMGYTYFRKFLDDVFENNLDVKTKDTISKKSSNWSFRLMDDYTVQKIYRMLEAQKEVNMSTDEFYDLIEAKMHVSCKGCTKNRCECDFHTFLDSKFVPPMREDSECVNCEYAY